MHSEMHVFTTRSRRQKQFAWLTGAGIYHGQMSISSKMARAKKADIVSEKDIMQYPQGGSNDLTPPISIGVSEFHFITLYSDQLQVITQLNLDKSKPRVAFEEAFRMKRVKGEPRGLVYDPRSGQHWIFSDRFLFKLIITAEDRNMWQLHLDKGQYEEALVFCKTNAQKDAVLTKQAAKCFEDKNYDSAATYYAKTSMSFEEITLKFVNQEEPEALQTFLLNKLENIGNDDATQLTLICTWLVEIYLDLINKADDDGDPSAAETIVKNFRMFLADNNEHLD
eukprot:SAG11_NODE_3906_length_2156_cov_1.129315_1_plen_280_part_10